LTKTTASVLIPSRKEKKVSALVPLQKESAGTNSFNKKKLPVLLYRRKVTVLAPLQKNVPVRISLQKKCRYAFLYRKKVPVRIP